MYSLLKSKGKSLLLVLVLIVTVPAGVSAWGVIGHRVVGEIAFLHLSAKAKKEIALILGNESLALSSTWADFIRSDTSYNYLGPWHYINVDQGYSFSKFADYLANDTAVDAYTKMLMIVDTLKSPSLNMQSKKMYLRLLVHIVGDLHQPLHVGQRSDLGGNRIRVQWFNEQSNLHRLWDENLVDFQQLSYTEYVKAINFSTKSQKAAWQKQKPAEWLFESYTHAGKIYAGIKEENPRLGYRYNFDYVDMMNSQLLKAGIRLAGILNEIYK